VSIEAREGVTTGISAADRAHTIAVAINNNRGRDDIVSPGHIFPLVAQDGGVLVRAGHTEAAVDVSRLAGLNPSGVICEIMNDDGTMARMPDLMTFAQEHGLKIATIADLIAYRRRTEKLIELVASSKINSRFGGAFDVRVYANKVTYAEHLAIVCGDVSGDEPVYVRVHQHNLLADSLGDETASVFFRGEARSRAGRDAGAERAHRAARLRGCAHRSHRRERVRSDHSRGESIRQISRHGIRQTTRWSRPAGL
jgi:3,4-dihydroxy 2-butanone 4-phosphate synthase/GTP cyclohydrolase II